MLTIRLFVKFNLEMVLYPAHTILSMILLESDLRTNHNYTSYGNLINHLLPDLDSVVELRTLTTSI